MSRAKDFHRCLRNLHRFTAGQVTVVGWDTDTFSELLIDVSPNGGLYNGGQFRFQIELENSVPTVTCLTNIYHPNIDPTERYENVCLNILNDWPPSYGLQDCIQGILFLLHNPNLDDPLSPYFDDFYDEQEFAKNVRSSLLGEEVEGVTFDTRRSPTATGTMTSTEPELEDTLDLGNFFSDQKQQDTFGLKHLFAEQKQVCVEDVSAEDTAVGVENVFVDRKQEDSFDLGNALGDQNQEDSVGVENICADRKQETTAGLGNNFADDETVVDLAGSATVENHTPEACGDLIKDPSSRVMLHRPHEKGARLILACKHSCQTVIPVLRKLYKLLNVAAICVRYSLSHTHRQPAERSTCYE